MCSHANAANIKLHINENFESQLELSPAAKRARAAVKILNEQQFAAQHPGRPAVNPRPAVNLTPAVAVPVQDTATEAPARGRFAPEAPREAYAPAPQAPLEAFTRPEPYTVTEPEPPYSVTAWPGLQATTRPTIAPAPAFVLPATTRPDTATQPPTQEAPPRPDPPRQSPPPRPAAPPIITEYLPFPDGSPCPPSSGSSGQIWLKPFDPDRLPSDHFDLIRLFYEAGWDRDGQTSLSDFFFQKVNEENVSMDSPIGEVYNLLCRWVAEEDEGHEFRGGGIDTTLFRCVYCKAPAEKVFVNGVGICEVCRYNEEQCAWTFKVHSSNAA